MEEVMEMELSPGSPEPELQQLGMDEDEFLLAGTAIIGMKDMYCWVCHCTESYIYCSTCPRSFHQNCIKEYNPGNWQCSECKIEPKKLNNPKLPIGKLLQFALDRITDYECAQPYHNFKNHAVTLVDITVINNKIRNNVYESTSSFFADFKWIYHNSVIFNAETPKLVESAKQLLTICKEEIVSIETCADCYNNANIERDTWFVKVCTTPHILVWAKLRGHPYWPAKVMLTRRGFVNVKFFGSHDHSWIPVENCYLFSRRYPVARTTFTKAFQISVTEIEVHIENLLEKYNRFRYAPKQTKYNPTISVKYMLPNFDRYSS